MFSVKTYIQPRNYWLNQNENSATLFFFRGLEKAKSSLPLFQTGTAVSAQCVSSVAWTISCINATKRDKKTESQKQQQPFPKWDINMTIQLQALTVHTLASLLYIKKHPSTRYPMEKTFKSTQFDVFTDTGRTRDFSFSCHHHTTVKVNSLL